ncbi:MAG: hypothetical protein U0528_04700 [Anaerolineae bacterium]
MPWNARSDWAHTALACCWGWWRCWRSREQINAQVQQEVNRGQREMYLREQMRAIQNELGEIDIFQQEINDLRERIDQANMRAKCKIRR